MRKSLGRWLLLGLVLVTGSCFSSCRRGHAGVPPFQRLASALDSGDDSAALAACEDYLKGIPGRGADVQQVALVRSVYSRVFVAWYVRQVKPDAAVRARAARYRELMAAGAPEGGR